MDAPCLGRLADDFLGKSWLLGRGGETCWSLRFPKGLLLFHPKDEIGAPLGLRGSGEDHLGVVLELFDPGAEVGGRVVELDLVQNPRLIGKERGPELRDQLLLGVSL